MAKAMRRAARASGLRSGDEAAPATFDDMSRLNPFKETRQ